MARNPLNHILLLALLSLFQLALGQTEVKKLHFGLSLTPQLSVPVFDGEYLQRYEPRFGVAFGGDVNVDLGSKFQLRTGLEYQLARITYRDYSPMFPGDVENGEADVYKSYFDFRYVNSFMGVPIDLKYKLAKPQSINHVFVSAGLAFRYLISSSGEIQLVESGTPTISYDPETFLFSGHDIWFYFTGGLGYEFKLGRGKCSIQPRYEFSPIKLLEEDASAIGNGHPAFVGIKISYY